MLITFAVLAFLTIIVTPLLFMLASKKRDRASALASEKSSAATLPEEILHEDHEPQVESDDISETIELFNPENQQEPEDRNPRKHFK
ncbi:hypothetical protein MASR1M107_29900 [Ignavibacteriales bacterium]